MNYKWYLKWVIIAILAILFLVIYKIYNPLESHYFPKCPFKAVTTLDCPGCGSQRAIHNLLNLNITDAFKNNPMLFITLPYVILGYGIRSVKNPSVKLLEWRKRLYGLKAIYVVTFIIIIFWIGRNIWN